MCGIIGIINHEFTREQIESSINLLNHRGPDGSGVYIDKDAKLGFGHSRLSIIDLATGDQPLFDKTGNIILVCNGEIYDFENIRKELESKGHKFSTKSDSEVIIYLYLEYGINVFEHLRGEFAFLLFDKRNNTVIAARDRFGIKPLYFVRDGNSFVFASEAKGIFGTGLHKPEIDVLGVRDMLSFVAVDSIFAGIDAVPPGHYIKIHLDGDAECVKYWDLDLSAVDQGEEEKSLEDYVSVIREKLDEAVKLRLRADVPVGVYLSGGLDSAAVAGTVSKFSPGRIKAFTVEFTEDEKFDESGPAKRMAGKIGADFLSVKCDNETLLKNLEECLWKSEIPTHNLHGVGKFMLSRLAREHVKVVLTGEGGDETFLGYEYFKREGFSIARQLEGREDKPRTVYIGKPHIKKLMDSIGFIPIPEMAVFFSNWRQFLFKRVFASKHRQALGNSHPLTRLKTRIDRSQTDNCSWERKIQYFSIKGIMAPYILSVLGDRQEMAHSIEGRTPLLDHHLFEAARRVPDKYKIHEGEEKYIFREAVKDRITPEIYERKKWPFSAPPACVEKGQNPVMDKMIRKYLSRAAVEKAGIFNYAAILRLRLARKIICFDCAFRRDINSLFFFMLTVQILHRLYVQEFPRTSRK